MTLRRPGRPRASSSLPRRPLSSSRIFLISFGSTGSMQQPEELGFDSRGWISASSTHNWSEQNQLVDWLNIYGKEFGFVPDAQRPDHDSRFSYVSAVLRQSWAFERAVVKWLASVSTVRQIGHGPTDARSLAKRRETEMAMRAGVSI